jgi:AraC-like DNA-binding protein
MPIATVLKHGPVSVVDYKCDTGPHEASYVELHESFAVSFVRKGSFGYHYRGATHDLVSGSVLLGYAGDEFRCTHEHHDCGDECLSFHFTPEAVDAIAGGKSAADSWRMGYLPPLPEIMVLGELAQTIADGRSDIGLDEIALTFASRFIEIAADNRRKPLRLAARDRLRAVEAASWIAEHSHLEIDLDAVAATANLSSFHFLRVFSQVLGVTPHQYLVRSRLRSAARLLVDDHRPITEIAMTVGFGDLSNFVRTFHRAAGVSPRQFRVASKQDRKIFQDRLAAR